MTDFSIIKKLFVITELNGFAENEIHAVKDIFGDLPKVFIDYYTELGKIQKLNNCKMKTLKIVAALLVIGLSSCHAQNNKTKSYKTYAEVSVKEGGKLEGRK